MEDDKVFKFRGKTTEELKALSIEEFSNLIDSVSRRKIKRGFTVQENKLLDKIKNGERNIKTHCRDMIVLPNMIGQKIGIYNGKEFVSIHFVPEMIGLRFGELAPTRRIGVSHSGGGGQKKGDMRK